MIVLPETQEALAEIAATQRYGVGEHFNHLPATRANGLVIGSTPFDETRHSVAEIDHFSPLGLALNEPYVREVLPARPMTMQLVVDGTSRKEHPGLTAVKSQLVLSLDEAFKGALPGMTDRVQGFVVGDNPAFKELWDYEYIPAHENLDELIRDLAVDGLTMVVSDFRHLSFEPAAHELSEVVAVKVNHMIERQLQPNRGVRILNGLVSVNTNKPKELARVNESLETEHQTIVKRLEQAGAAVACVIVDPRQQNNLDVRATDTAIATAIYSQLSS